TIHCILIPKHWKIMNKIKNIIVMLSVMPFLFSCGDKVTEQENYDISGKMELEYAEQFSVRYLENGCSLIEINDGQKFMLVPENIEISEEENITVIQQPVENIYVGASSAVDLFDGAGAIDDVKMVSTKLADWCLPSVKNALENGKMIYVGKYSTPDYEILLAENCGLAVESTMIYHSPETKEQLENLGIPVLTERSSYETHPLGRLEWIKLYGLITGHEKEAEEFFNKKIEIFNDTVLDNITENKRPTVVFFYITANGYANVRKSGDYISKMIELAGGQYIFTADDLKTDENALSTMNVEMETFYQKAKNADYIIYNSTVDGGIYNISQLVEKNALLSDFKAVKNNNVWCTEKNMFQQTTGTADMIRDIHLIITGQADNAELQFLHHLGGE
ncbi:MAG: ABC transporter substrate-binding protein, partial [Ruminococcus sp.]|nr:ABC transporter substrate-binding protein [Ruminococcus sp.]